MKKQVPLLQFSKEQRKGLGIILRDYVQENFETSIGNLQAELFIDFLSEQIGPCFYNKGIADSSKYFSERAEDLYTLMKDETQF